MNQIAKGITLKVFMLFLAVTCLQIIVPGQEVVSDTVKTKTVTEAVETGWIASPWILVAGAVVLILLLVALLPRRRSRPTDTKKETMTKTTTIK